jgi:creatinine amidohydrolase
MTETNGRPYVLAETTWKDARAMPYEVAVLPWGATEAHNYHLPYGTDVVETDAVACESARLAWERGARVIVLPTIPFGVQTGQRDIALCVNMNPSTQAAVLRDIIATLDGQRVRKLVIINGHGGNDFKQMIRELQPAATLLLATVNWWQVVDASAFFAEPGDHAGELETSMMLHLAPALVRPLSEAGDGHERRPRIAAMRERWAWTPRPWTKVSADTGIGDPRAATAGKGAAYFAAVTEKVAGFLVDLAHAEPSDLYV